MKLSITLSGLSLIYGDDLAGVVETARIADDLGLHQIVVPDHVAIGPRTDLYPYGRFPLPKEEPWLEPLTTLAAMAGATSRIRLGTGILIVPLRPPALLAKTVASLDALSRGRLDLGVGSGWQREEFIDVPFEFRMARMWDTLRACRAFWTEAPARFRSQTTEFEDIWSLPHPVQERGVPLWMGVALSESNLERIVELGSGWLPMTSDLEELAVGARRLGAAFAAAGRNPEEIGIRANAPVVSDSGGRPDVAATLAALPALAEAGVTIAGFALARFARSRDEVRPFLEQLAKHTG